MGTERRGLPSSHRWALFYDVFLLILRTGFSSVSFFIDTNQTTGNLVHKHKTMKFDVVVERPVTDNVYPNQLNRLKRVEKLHPLKSQPMFSEAPRWEWREPFDFQPDFRISPVNAKYRSFDKLFTFVGQT